MIINFQCFKYFVNFENVSKEFDNFKITLKYSNKNVKRGYFKNAAVAKLVNGCI